MVAEIDDGSNGPAEEDGCAAPVALLDVRPLKRARVHAEVHAAVLAARQARSTLQRLLAARVALGRRASTQTLLHADSLTTDPQLDSLRIKVKEDLAALDKKVAAARVHPPNVPTEETVTGELPESLRAAVATKEPTEESGASDWRPRFQLQSRSSVIAAATCWTAPDSADDTQSGRSLIAIAQATCRVEVWQRNDMSWHSIGFSDATEDMVGGAKAGNDALNIHLEFASDGAALWLAFSDIHGGGSCVAICGVPGLDEENRIKLNFVHKFVPGGLLLRLAPAAPDGLAAACQVACLCLAGDEVSLGVWRRSVPQAADNEDPTRRPEDNENPKAALLDLRADWVKLWSGVSSDKAGSLGLAAIQEGERLVVWIPWQCRTGGCADQSDAAVEVAELQVLDLDGRKLASMELSHEVSSLSVPPQPRCPPHLFAQILAEDGGHPGQVEPFVVLMQTMEAEHGHRFEVCLLRCPKDSTPDDGKAPSTDLQLVPLNCTMAPQLCPGSLADGLSPYKVTAVSAELLALEADSDNSVDSQILDWRELRWHSVPREGGWRPIALGKDLVLLRRISPSPCDAHHGETCSSELLFLEPDRMEEFRQSLAVTI
mmetsp:Transcript_25412/g.59129  ORF Transcript_25412/g.59129 Transcript_25412/m.59129 type:complete len:602 (-) Transcript_25412:47-1852(-)